MARPSVRDGHRTLHRTLGVRVRAACDVHGRIRGCNACSRRSRDAKSLTFFRQVAPPKEAHNHGHPPSVRAATQHEARRIEEREVIDDTGTRDPYECAARELAATLQICSQADRSRADADASERGSADTDARPANKNEELCRHRRSQRSLA